MAACAATIKTLINPQRTEKMTRVLVIEDTTDLREELVDYLHFRGYTVQGVGSLAAMHALLGSTEPWHVLVLDLGLPDGDGTLAAQQLRQSVGLDVGIVMVTARGQLEDRLLGLHSGADAYLVKPVDLRELCAVIDRLALRVAAQLATPLAATWQVLRDQHLLQCPNGCEVPLTGSECLVLAHLLTCRGQVVSRDVLEAMFTAGSSANEMRKFDSLLSRLRSKVLEQAGVELPVRTYRSQGYAFED